MLKLKKTLDQLSDIEVVTKFLREKFGPDVKRQTAGLVFLTDSQIRKTTPLLELIPDSNEPYVIAVYDKKLMILTMDGLSQYKDGGESIASFQGVKFSYRHPVESPQSWLDYRHEDDDKKEAGQVALRVQRKLRRRKHISVEDLEPILAAIRSPYMVSWDVGMGALSKLAGQHPAARDGWESILKEPKAKVRERALRNLGDHLPKSFCIRILRQALQDRSKEVRRHAAHRTECLDLTEMLDDLLLLQTTEKNTDVQSQLEYSIDMFQQGFHYNKQYGSLWVRMENGGTKSVGGRTYNREYYESHDLKTVAEEIRRKFANEWETPRQWDWPVELSEED